MYKMSKVKVAGLGRKVHFNAVFEILYHVEMVIINVSGLKCDKK
jgi:hypothetical protein